MLERREAELREAMKLRHSLTTLLHALRVDMEHVSKKKQESLFISGHINGHCPQKPSVILKVIFTKLSIK